MHSPTPTPPTTHRGEAPVTPKGPIGAGSVTAHRKQLQWPRRIFHLVNGVVIALTYMLTGLEQGPAIAIMGCITLLTVGADFLRLRMAGFNERVIKDFLPLMREYETHRLSSASYFVLGAFLAIVVLPKPVAIAAVLYLALGDPLSSVVGILFGRIPLLGKKSLEGSLACFNVCFLAGLVVLMWAGVPPHVLPLAALFGGFGAAVAEALPVELDDNLRIPLIGGLVLWATLWVLAGPAVAEQGLLALL